MHMDSAQFHQRIKEKLSLYVLVSILTVLCVFNSEHVFSASSTLAKVQMRGAIQCGVNANLKGFSTPNSLGVYSGFDVDFCRAVSSAIFDNPDKVDFIALTSTQRFEALKYGYIDILARNTTWTMLRNTQHGEFVGINFIDGQGFMLAKLTGLQSVLQLDNISLCLIKGTSSELKASEFFRLNRLRFNPIYRSSNAEILIAYENGACKAVSTDLSRLASIRTSLIEPEAHMFLPEVISKEPLGPMVRSDDGEWENITRWSLNCLINAEELGVSSANVDTKPLQKTPAVQRILGLADNYGKQIGLDRRWCRNIIKHVGNYAEIYERHLGEGTPLSLKRGINELWTNGGLIFAPPIR